jgi:hypothetical protein
MFLWDLCFSKFDEDSYSENILCHACFFLWNHRRIMIMHYWIGCLNDGSILPFSQKVLTPSEG